MPSPTAPRDSGIELQTLVITAAASVTAAFVTSKVWAAGTLASAAVTPVLVALVKEGLRKPTEVVTAAVPVRGRGRPARSTTAAEDYEATLRDGPPPPTPPPVQAETGPVTVYSTRARRLRWRLAVITGLLGFGIAVALYTVPELLAGGSAGRSGAKTTFFGGKKRKPSSSTTETTQTAPATTAPATTVTTPAETVTTPAPAPETTPTAPAPPAATTTPAETAPPAQTEPATPTTP
ncbi:MAG: hypothetical protein HZB46_03030 [Solirubrobacterales bacterium]|nr:hypothetical protein [Solirubrobacterales bacterium]